MKRLLSLLMVAVISLSPTLTYAAENRFTDVKRGDWFYEGVIDAVDKQLFYGISETEFAPQLAMSRGMFLTVLGKLAGVDTNDYKNIGAFTDVPDGAYYTAYVNWAVEKGICVGIGYNLFAPHRAVTREEAMLMLYHYTDAYEIELNLIDKREFIFTDIRNLSSISREAITRLAAAMVIDGRTATTFDARAHLTRAEAAQIMLKVYYIYNDLRESLTAETLLTGSDGLFTIDLPAQWRKRVIVESVDNHLGTDDGSYSLTVSADMTSTPPELFRIDVVAQGGVRAGQYYQNGRLRENYKQLDRIEVDGGIYLVLLHIDDLALKSYKGDQLITFRRIWLSRDLALETLKYTASVTLLE